MTGAETAARNKRNYLEAKGAFNRGDLNACMAYYALDHHLRSRPVGPGREHIEAFLTSMRAMWTDLEIIAEHVIAEGDWVMGRRLSTAVHSAPVMGIAPTSRRVEAAFWDLHRFNEDGLIVESWNISDGLAIMQQLTASELPACGRSKAAER